MKEEDNDVKDHKLPPYQNKPPDGGWGWVVVLSAFVINVITDGCSYSFGVLFAFLLEYFQETRSTTAWIGSVFNSVPLLCGPIASLVTNRLGFRKTTIIGGFITAAGFISSAFVNSVGAMSVTYGCIAGLGISLPYLTSIVVVASYFEKKRTLVTGIAECGAGIGTLIFAPLYQHLISLYGWRGAILIVGAISFNIVVCGALFRPISVSREQIVDETVPEDVYIDNNEQIRTRVPAESNLSAIPLLKINEEIRRSLNSLTLESHSVLGESVTLTPPVLKAAISSSAIDEIEPKKKCSNKKSLVDVTVLSNGSFVIFTLSSIILYFWYDVPYVFTVDRAKGFGITEKMAALMVSVIGITHTLGNLLYGYLGDRKWVNRTYLYSGSLLLTGIVLGLIPLFTSFLPSTILAGLFGLLSASAEALTSVIIVDILGIEKLTDAFGIVMFLQGIANLIGPPVAGWLYDRSSSYDDTFYSAGSCIGIAAVIVFFTTFWKRKNK